MSKSAKILSTTLGMIARNPSGSAGIFIFSLGFLLIAGNAIYGQKSNHPNPVYEKADQQVSTDLVKRVSVKPSPVPRRLTTQSVLTQRISISNIPIPTANPARNKSIAAHSSLVRDVQAGLASVGLYKGKVDGIYGSGTRRSIIDYQQRAGILPDGEASYGLLSTLKSARAIAKLQQQTTQENGEISEPKRTRQPQLLVFDTDTVAKIQTGLRKNFAEEKVSVDGLIGKQTRSAIRRFQERFKLKATGELNEETMQKLLSAGVISTI